MWGIVPAHGGLRSSLGLVIRSVSSVRYPLVRWCASHLTGHEDGEAAGVRKYPDRGAELPAEEVVSVLVLSSSCSFIFFFLVTLLLRAASQFT